MQSKISTFFKRSSATEPKFVDPSRSPVIDGEKDELDIWEKKQHQIFVTYQRRRLNPNMYVFNQFNFHHFDVKCCVPLSFSIEGNLFGCWESCRKQRKIPGLLFDELH